MIDLDKKTWIPVPDRVEDRLCAGMTDCRVPWYQLRMKESKKKPCREQGFYAMYVLIEERFTLYPQLWYFYP